MPPKKILVPKKAVAKARPKPKPLTPELTHESKTEEPSNVESVTEEFGVKAKPFAPKAKVKAKAKARAPPKTKAAKPKKAPVPLEIEVQTSVKKETLSNFETSGLDPHSEEWLSAYQKYIFDLLSNIVTDEGELMRLVEQEPMQMWTDAVTFESFDPEHNYEELEMIGDVYLDAIYVRYLRRRFPGLKKDELTELRHYYMTTQEQPQLAIDLGLEKWIRIKEGTKLNHKIIGDVLEAFFGALLENGDYLGMSGHDLCYKMIQYIFDQKEIDLSVTKGKEKSQVLQNYFQRLGWNQKGEDHGPIKETEIMGPGQYNTRLVMTPLMEDFFKKENIHYDSTLIAEGMGASKQASEASAFRNALQQLVNYGMTEEVTRQIQHQRKWANPKFVPYMYNVGEKMKKDGIVSIDFFTPKKQSTVGETVIQLIGYDNFGNSSVLATYTGSDRNEGRVEVLRQYIS